MSGREPSDGWAARLSRLGEGPRQGRDPDGDRAGSPLDRTAGFAPDDGAVPPMGAALEAALAGLHAVPPRRPVRQAITIVVLSLGWALATVGALTLRRDLAELPRLWLAIYLAAWLAGFIVPTVLLVVPRRGSMMPRWPLAAAIGALAAVGFVAAGLVLARSGPSSSARGLDGAHLCVSYGLATALAPTLLGVLALRGAVPNASRPIAAALGAAAGCVGGFALHLHCPIADRLHVGIAHGGVVLLAAALAALIAPRWLRAR